MLVWSHRAALCHDKVQVDLRDRPSIANMLRTRVAYKSTRQCSCLDVILEGNHAVNNRVVVTDHVLRPDLRTRRQLICNIWVLNAQLLHVNDVDVSLKTDLQSTAVSQAADISRLLRVQIHRVLQLCTAAAPPPARFNNKTAINVNDSLSDNAPSVPPPFKGGPVMVRSTPYSKKTTFGIDRAAA